MHGITRVDHEGWRTHAWRVTIQRQDKIHVGHFSDGVYEIEFRVDELRL